MVPSKTRFGVFPAQELIRDRIRSCDMLVISIGGNDIALAPSICTIVAMVLLKLALNFRCVHFSELRACQKSQCHWTTSLEDANTVATPLLLPSSSGIFHRAVSMSG